MKPTLGVFGFGQFMKFFIPHLRPYFDIKVYDREDGTNEDRNEDIRSLRVTSVGMQEAAECDYVLLGYPAKNIESLLEKIYSYLREGAVVFDICSVKTPAVSAMKKYVPEYCDIMSIHPIFGPQSGKNSVEGLKCTFSNIRSSDEKYNFLKDVFGNKIGLKVFEVSSEEHDAQMAYIQGVTHFIGRTLKSLDIPNSALATCSYNDLRNSSETVGYDSDELFLSIQQDNPYVGEIRASLLAEFQKQNTWIEDNKI